MMMSKTVVPLYFTNPNLFQCKAVVTLKGTSEINKKNYHWIQLSDTIFHPKGGGQLADSGTINGVPVIYVHKEMLDKNRPDHFEIKHCFAIEQEVSCNEGDVVQLEINRSLRRLYSRMHTAGHLLAMVSEKIFPNLHPFHGNHDPEDGYVRFKTESEFLMDSATFKATIEPELKQKIAENLPVLIQTLPTGLRGVQIEETVMPCGGTHVERLGEIKKIHIGHISFDKKESIVKVKYQISLENNGQH